MPPHPLHVFWRGPGTLAIDRRAYHAPIREDVARRFRAKSAAPPPPPLKAQKTGDGGEAGARATPTPTTKPNKQTRLLLLKGGDVIPVYDTDGEILLRQEAFFHHLFGVEEEGFLGVLDLDTAETALFAPRLPASYAVWFGKLEPPSHYRDKYAVDAAFYRDEIGSWLAERRPAELHVLAGVNTDSGADAAILAPSDAEELAEKAGCPLVRGGAAFEALVESRVHKTPLEVEVLAYVNAAASKAHVSLMREAARRHGRRGAGDGGGGGKEEEEEEEGGGAGKEGGGEPGEIMREFQLEALFQHETYSRSGCRFQGYTPIVASGPNAAVLHYGHSGAPNDGPVLESHLVLVDAGCEYYRHTSDITCTWPAGGKFTPDQRLVYEAVLSAHSAVLAGMGPGVSWRDMHTLAYRRILGALTKGGLLRGDVEEMLEAEVGALFMPHGLGHFLGLSTHDVGGYRCVQEEEAGAKSGGGEEAAGAAAAAAAAIPPRVDRPGYRSLRTARVLEPGMVITVEPGCYFSFEALLDPVLRAGEEGEGEGGDSAAAAALRRRQSAFLVPAALERFRGFGGVRLEDNVLITPEGRRSLTDVPRTVEDVEAVMAGGPWPPSPAAA